MPRRRHEAQAEPLDVVVGIPEREQFQFLGVRRARVDGADPERAAAVKVVEDLAHLGPGGGHRGEVVGWTARTGHRLGDAGAQQQRVEQAGERHPDGGDRRVVARGEGHHAGSDYFTVNGTDATLFSQANSIFPELGPVAVSVILNVSTGAGGLLMSIATRPRSWSLL